MQIVVANSKGGVGKTTIVMALADMLGAQIVEHDLQGTIKKCHEIIKESTNGKVLRHLPVDAGEVTAKHVIHDTPPYNNDEFSGLFRSADLVVIPVKVSEGDLVACKAVIDRLRQIKRSKKAVIVFNEVRKPRTSVYRRVRGYFDSSYDDVKKAKTELSNLVGFRSIMSKPVYGNAKKEMSDLLMELGIY